MKPQTKTVTVTVDHIAQGTPGSAFHCPVAKALVDALGLDSEVAVYGHNFSYEIPGYGRANQSMPDFVATWVHGFDSGHNVAPFSFDILYP